MRNFDKFLWFFPKGALYENLRSKELQIAFLNEINFVNFQRLRILSVIAFCVLSLLLILDFNTSVIWDESTINRFKVVDLSFLLFLLFPLYISFFRPPKSKKELSKFHLFTIKISVLSFLAWSAIVSANEWATAGGIPTFVIGVFVICTIFIHRGAFIFLALTVGMACLPGFLFLFDIDYVNLIQKYISYAFMVIIALIISRILLNTKIKAFSAQYELETTNACLDELVKARTRQLTDANERLKNEIAEREKYERQLQKEKERAEEADKLKSSFLANMSHEIRTPLNGIVGFSDLLQTSDPDEDKRQKYASIIKRNSHQLLKIIDDIIDISMIESNQLNFQFSTTTIKQILDTSIDFFNAYQISAGQKKIKFKNINLLPNSDVEMYTDPLRVQQVIYNLLNNALKFTETGSIQLLARLDTDEVFFCVEDTGIGIEPEKSEIIFERFIQIRNSTEKNFGGSGLGLSISHGIIQVLNGNIWLDYSYTGGSRFCFTIPVKRPLRKISAGEKLKVESRLSEGKHILIITPSDKEFLYLKKLFISGKISHEKYPSESGNQKFDIVIYSNIESFNGKIATDRNVNEYSSFYIFNNYDELELARKSGCKYCYLSPLNINKFVKEINSELIRPE